MSYYGCDEGHIAAAGAGVYILLLHIKPIKPPQYHSQLYQVPELLIYQNVLIIERLV